MTLSIVARDPATGMFGVAISSSSPAVAARCAYARSAAGAVATQNITDPRIGPLVLGRMEQGDTAQAALEAVLNGTPFSAYRQVLVIGANGPPAVHSGTEALGTVAAAEGRDAAAAGNLLAGADVPAAMIAAFEAVAGHLGARLIAALRAGVAQGGEAGPLHSAGLVVVHRVSWPIVDLRVDWSEGAPVDALAAIWNVYEPQIDAYVRRALDPAQAPRFGVPGDP